MPIQIQLTGVQNLTAAERHIVSSRVAFQIADRSIITQAGTVMRAALRSACPRKTGATADSIGFRTVAVPSGIAARFYGSPVVQFLVEGTQPHEIWAGIFTGGGEGKAALFWKGADHPVTHVNHPGTKANDFRKKAWIEAGGPVTEILRQTGRAILRGDSIGAAL